MLPDPICDLKQAAGAALARRIEGWPSAHDAAAFLGTDRARIGDIRRGTLKAVLVRLLRLLVRAGARVEIRLTVACRGEPRASFIDEANQ